MAQPGLKYYSAADYLALERESNTKHFYYDGEIFAIAGASYEHNVIEDNLRVALGNHLKDKPCRSFGSNLRLHVPGESFYTYPDVMVICGKPQFLADAFDTVTNPTLLIEILSEGTADYDKGLKFDLYRRIGTLKEYLMLDAHKMHLMHYTRNENDTWTLREATAKNAVAELTSIGMRFLLRDCYTGLDMPA